MMVVHQLKLSMSGPESVDSSIVEALLRSWLRVCWWKAVLSLTMNESGLCITTPNCEHTDTRNSIQ